MYVLCMCQLIICCQLLAVIDVIEEYYYYLHICMCMFVYYLFISPPMLFVYTLMYVNNFSYLVNELEIPWLYLSLIEKVNASCHCQYRTQIFITHVIYCVYYYI